MDLPLCSRKRKTKCSGSHPVCRNCLRGSRECIWPSITDDTSLSRSWTEERLPSSSNPRPIYWDLKDSEVSLLIQTFFTQPNLCLVSHSFHRPSLEGSPREDIPPFLLYALGALASLFLSDDAIQPRGVQNLDSFSDQLAARAQRFSRETSDSPSVSNTQANILLAYRELLCARGLRAWMYAGVAIRMAQALRLGKEYHCRQSPLEREVRRRVMWTCFVLDRVLSMITSRPPTIMKQYLAIQLPCPENEFMFAEAFTAPDLWTLTQSMVSQNIFSFLIKGVDIWAEMLLHFDLENKLCPNTVTSAIYPSDSFMHSQDVARQWLSGLSPRLQWSPDNYFTHKTLGTSCLYVTNLLILNHASCYAQLEYLPQRADARSTTSQTQNDDDWRSSTLHQSIVSTSLLHAEEIYKIAMYVANCDEVARDILQTPFCGVALVTAASIFLWCYYFGAATPEGSGDRSVGNDLVQEKVLGLFSILSSWTPKLDIAKTWCETIELLTVIYATAYEKPLIDFPQSPGQYHSPGIPIMQLDIQQESDHLPARDPQSANTATTSRPGAPTSTHLQGGQEAITFGNGVPEPSGEKISLLRKIKNTIKSASESSELRRAQTAQYVQALLREMYSVNNSLSFNILSADDHGFAGDILADLEFESLLEESYPSLST